MLEMTQVDIDNDGVTDTLYRLRQIRRAAVGGTNFNDWVEGTCRTDFPDPVFYYFALDQDSPQLAKFLGDHDYLQGAQLVRYQGQTYVWNVGPNGGSIEQMLQADSILSLREIFYGQYKLGSTN